MLTGHSIAMPGEKVHHTIKSGGALLYHETWNDKQEFHMERKPKAGANGSQSHKYGWITVRPS
jgi:hypothetical protein